MSVNQHPNSRFFYNEKKALKKFNKANDQYCEKRKARIEEEARLIEEWLNKNKSN